MGFNLKNTLFGLGVGIIVMYVVFYYVHGMSGDYAVVAATALSDFSDEEITRAAAQLGMIFMTDLPAASLSDEDIRIRAAALGMVLAEEMPPQNGFVPASVGNTAEAAVGGEAMETVLVTIPVGYDSNSIAWMLYEAGVVDDAVGFGAYLRQQGVTTRLQSGTMHLPINGDYTHVLRIITGRTAG